MTTRRLFLTGAAACLAFASMPGRRRAHATTNARETLERAFADLEAESGGRLGVAVIGTGSGLAATRRRDERFPLCSTFKWLAAAAVLARADRGELTLDDRVPVRAEDIVTYSPATEAHAGESMSLGSLCEAAITLSDNTAGNLILRAIGGPEGFNAFVRSLGDRVTRLDRIEPDLNEAAPGDPRDTTTPSAMAGDLKALLLGDALSQGSRGRLTAWLAANKTGDARLRAGLPDNWRCGDKTGTCNRHTANDVGILWPPDGAPVLVAVYLAEAKASGDAQNAAIAGVARAIVTLID